jgi:PhnB protein
MRAQSKRAKSTPEGFHTLTPYLVVDDVKAARDFYVRVFNAETVIEREIKGRLVLAGIMIGDSHVQLSDRSNDQNVGLEKGGAIGLRVYVDDADATFGRALEAGAKQLAPVEDKFWGDRLGEIIDPSGFRWRISQHLEEVDHKEIERRMHEKLG